MQILDTARSAALIARPVTLTLALILLQGCGGGQSPEGAVDLPAALQTGPVETPVVAERISPPSLPEFRELEAATVRHRGVSDIDFDHLNYGGAFSTLFGSRNTAASGFLLPKAVFSPQFAPGDSIGEAAWCIYSFLPWQLPADTTLNLDWETAPASGNLWIGLSSPLKPAWDWFAADPQAGIQFDPAERTLSSGQLYVVVLVLGQDSAVLEKLSLGNPGLTAVLTVDESGGGFNFIHHFSAAASLSFDGSALSSFDWDWDGDGVIDETTAFPETTHQYPQTGAHFARVRVTTASGAQDWDSVPVFTLAEAEQNDTNVLADPLPAFPFHGWAGHCGAGDNSQAGVNDGDNIDISTFTADLGQTVSFQLLSFGTCSHAFDLRDAEGDILAFANQDNSGLHRMNRQLQPGDVAPYYLRVLSAQTLGGGGFYLLEGSFGEAPQASLNWTVISSGFPLQISFDPAASTDPDGTLVLYEMDYENDGIYDASNSDGSVFEHAFADAYLGDYRATLRVTDNDGNTGTSGFYYRSEPDDEELENNDAQEAANQLPNLPCQVHGSVGKGSYDGDNQDWWAFDAAPESNITVLLEYSRRVDSSIFGTSSSLENLLVVEVRDAAGNLVNSSGDSMSGHVQLRCTFAAQNMAPFTVRVRALSGGAEYSLRVAQGYPPGLVLTDYTYQTTVDAVVDFDPSASMDPDGPIAGWAWDFDGDGSIDTVAGPQTQTSYAQPGVYIGELMASDAEGLVARTYFSVFVGSDAGVLDEVENNDSFIDANILPTGSVIDFAGNIGAGGAYDGDSFDLFLLGSPAPGTSIELQLRFALGAGDMDFELLDGIGASLRNSACSDCSYETLSFVIGPDDPLPLYLKVYDDGGAADGRYLFSGVYD